MKKLILLAGLATAAIAVESNVALAAIIYDSRPNYAAGSNIISQGYTCCQLTELGDNIQFAGGPRNLNTVTVTLSNFSDTSYTHPITLNLYNVDAGPALGTLIASETQTVTVPAHVPNGHSGIAFDVSFRFPGTIVPDNIMFGLAFTNGLSSPSDPGPWDALNFGLWNYSVDGGTIPVGVDVGTVGVSTVVWGRTTLSPGWTSAVGNGLNDGLAPAVVFDAPEPGSLSLFGMGLAGFGFLRLSRRKKLSHGTEL